MLQKRIDTGSIPYGLSIAEVDLIKGRCVNVAYDSTDKVEYANYPTSEAEAQSVKGFVTYRYENEEGADSEWQTISANKRPVIYTLVKNNIWGTTEFVGTLAIGDKLVVDYGETNPGKLRALTSDEVTAKLAPQFKVVRVYDADTIFSSAMIDVEVL